MSYMPNTWVEEAAQRLGENWASYGSALELERAVADLAVEFLHGDNRENITESLYRDTSPENVASIAVDATLHAIKVIEDAGGNIDPDLPAHTLLKAVEYVMEIYHAVHYPFAEIGTVKSVRFLEKRVEHMSEKMYQTRGQDHA